MPMIESENFQNRVITYFIAHLCFEYVGYQLGQTGGFHFITPNGLDYFGVQTDKDSLKQQYNEDFLKNKDHAEWAKDEMTKWYNWTLKFEK